MSRTTLDIDKSVLEEIRRLQRKDSRSMGKIVSQLLADALAVRKESKETQEFKWISRPMRALIDLSDRDALYAALDKDTK